MFITFEGGEGVGKSTQIALLADYLKTKGNQVLTTREPGGTPNAESIRQLLVEQREEAWEPISELMLYLAARKEHVEKVISPALKQGTWVLCDRFSDSTIAYQGYGHGLDIAFIQQLTNLSMNHFSPDLTLLLDIPPKQGVARAKSCSGQEVRYEQMNMDFHERVRQGFLDLASQHPKRFITIDATQDTDAVFNSICRTIDQAIA